MRARPAALALAALTLTGALAAPASAQTFEVLLGGSPLGDAHLYRVRLSLKQDNAVIDRLEFKTGIRTIERAIAGTTRPLPVAGLAGFSRGDR